MRTESVPPLSNHRCFFDVARICNHVFLQEHHLSDFLAHIRREVLGLSASSWNSVRTPWSLPTDHPQPFLHRSRNIKSVNSTAPETFAWTRTRTWPSWTNASALASHTSITVRQQRAGSRRVRVLWIESTTHSRGCIIPNLLQHPVQLRPAVEGSVAALHRGSYDVRLYLPPRSSSRRDKILR